MISIWAITPMKSFKRPKSRLGDALSLRQRRILVKHMLSKVLLSQKKSNLFKEHLVVTEDEEVINFVKKNRVSRIFTKKGWFKSRHY